MTPNEDQRRPPNGTAAAVSSAATGIAGIAAGTVLGWTSLEVASKNQAQQTEVTAPSQEVTGSHPRAATPQQSSIDTQVSLHGLQGTRVTEENEIPPVLDTAEEAGACHEDLMRFESLIRHNVQQGVAVVFGTEYGTGAMGQYDPENNFILITPETVDMGIEETMKTLLHETVHAHQDHADGLDNATLEPLGLEINQAGVQYVEENYSGLDQAGTLLELEANSAEHNVGDTFDQLDINP